MLPDLDVFAGDGRRIGPAIDLIIRQYINAAWAVFSFILFAILVYYLWDQWRRRPLGGRFFIWRTYSHVQIATAMATVSFASFLRSTWTWILLSAQNLQDIDQTEVLATLWPLGLISAVMGIVGTLCMVRVLTRDTHGHWGWIVALFFGIFVIVSVEIW